MNTNTKDINFMCAKLSLNVLESKVSDSKLLLYNVQTLLKMGALSSDSAIIDSDLQTSKEDYYKLLKTINLEVQKVIKILDY